MEEKELICIGCPMGCKLTAFLEDGKVQSVTGNTCKRGEIYAQKELTNPTRIVTSTVKVKGGILPVVSVKTQQDIPKELIFQCMDELAKITLEAPVKIGEVVIEHVAGTMVNIVATKQVDKQK